MEPDIDDCILDFDLEDVDPGRVDSPALQALLTRLVLDDRVPVTAFTNFVS
uniref:hypothetical protein n=1 Tax=Paractinoplanes polyasparticus TaxID=2856853 RepID=UPI001C85E52D|nr:hypothetical protein [Actinoplanes polyasparticus]